MSNGPGQLGGEFTVLDPWKIPALNTLLLLSSGVTITFAHWALKKGQRSEQLPPDHLSGNEPNTRLYYNSPLNPNFGYDNRYTLKDSEGNTFC